MSAIAGIVGSKPGVEIPACVSGMCDIQTRGTRHGAVIIDRPGACIGHSPSRSDTVRNKGNANPVTLEKEQLAIAFDGVLYNRARLIETLDVHGTDKNGETDGKIVLEGYLKWGKECVAHLEGIFGFAIWDWNERTLFAARDHFGEKPFFYHLGPSGEFIFASEIKALLKSGRVPCELDHEAIYHYLYEKGFTAPRTPLSTVQSILPGYSLIWRDGKITLHKYWDVPYHEQTQNNPENALSRFGELLNRAVEKRIDRGTELGLLYSGGIDSSLTLAIINALTDKRIKTFTFVTGMRDEHLGLSRKGVTRFGTDHLEVILTPQLMAETLNEFVWCMSTPTVGSILTYFCARKAMRTGVDTILSGLCADATLLAESIYRKMMLVEKLLSPLRLMPEKARVDIYELTIHFLGRFFGQHSIRSNKFIRLIDIYAKTKRGVSHWYGTKLYADQIRRLFLPRIPRREWASPSDVYRDMFREYPSRALDDRYIHSVLKTAAYYASSNYESISAAFSMQKHTPFLDHRLLEYSRCIPYCVRSREGSDKYILRELCRKLLSSEFADQRKCAFEFPLREWLLGELRPLVDDALSRESIERRGFLDHGEVARMVEQFRGGTSNITYYDIWALIILEVWLRTHCDPSATALSKPPGIALADMVA